MKIVAREKKITEVWKPKFGDMVELEHGFRAVIVFLSGDRLGLVAEGATMSGGTIHLTFRNVNDFECVKE